MRAAIYARYSSDRQHERSIDDQVALCEKHLASLGGGSAEVYADYAISGAHLASRPSASRMLEDAADGKFDIVIAEALDRLSRDQEHIAAIYKQLTFAGVKLITVSEGTVDELHIGLKGTMNAVFLRDLAAKIRRGQTGRVKAGKVPGGKAFGYDVVRQLDARGEPLRGERAINDEQAEIVRRIFKEYAAGMTAREIAKGLNNDGISSPFGGDWNASSINGNRARRSGILYNEGYLGFIIYNRVRMVKDPATGKRISRPNPPEEWLVEEAPHLRIIENDVWEAVQARKATANAKPFRQRRKPPHIFSGLIKCGKCGGGYTAKGGGYLGCTRHRESGVCNNGQTIKLETVEQRVLGGIQQRLLAPELVEEALKAYEEERARLRKEALGNKKKLVRRRGAVQREIDACVRAVLDGLLSDAIKQRLPELEQELAQLDRDLAALEDDNPLVEFHPQAAAAWKKRMEDLSGALKGIGPDKSQAREIIRDMVDRIELHPRLARGQFDIQLFGSLPGILNIMGGENKLGPKSAVQLVAEEGLEPPTRGL